MMYKLFKIGNFNLYSIDFKGREGYGKNMIIYTSFKVTLYVYLFHALK